MKLFSSTFAAIAVGGAMLAASSMTASATIVCRGNVCWHVKEIREPRHYPAEAGVIIHDDNWKSPAEERYEWRERGGEGHGYWRENEWINLPPGE